MAAVDETVDEKLRDEVHRALVPLTLPPLRGGPLPLPLGEREPNGAARPLSPTREREGPSGERWEGEGEYAARKRAGAYGVASRNLTHLSLPFSTVKSAVRFKATQFGWNANCPP